MKRAKWAELGKSRPFTRSLPERLRWVLPLAVCTLAFAVYSRSLLCGFVRDDSAQIIHNPQIQSWEYLPQLLGSHRWSQWGPDRNLHFYRPLFSVWMLLVQTVGGLSPWFWHLSSILLHVAATYLVLWLCQRLTASEAGAAAAATVFAVHPIHVDAVTWLSASNELLFTLFALGSILMLLESNKTGDPPRLWTSAALYCAGVFCKETGMGILPILVVIAWVRLKSRVEGGQVRRLWVAGSPYVGATAIYLLARWSVMHQVGVGEGEHSWAEVIYSSPSTIFFYLKKLIVPLGLSGCYVNTITASPTAGFWLGLAAIMVAVAFVAWLALRYSPVLGLAAALTVVPILPSLAVLRIYPQGDMTHDRYLYFSSVGLSLLVGMLVNRVWLMQKEARMALVAVICAVAVAFSAVTFIQQRFYQDDFAFFNRAIEISPSNGFAYSAIGNLYLDQGDTDLAVDQFRKANQVAPDNQEVSLFLARGLFVVKRYQESEAVLNQLLQTPGLNPKRRKSALLSLANVEISLGKLDYGQQLLKQVENSDPRFPQLHWALGVLFQRQGLLSRAQAEYEKEFQITGDEAARKQSATLTELIYFQSEGRTGSEISNH